MPTAPWGSIPGRIVEVGDLDNVVNVSNNSGSQELSVTLDDTDGTIKAIFDAHDVHKRTGAGLSVFHRPRSDRQVPAL